MMIIESPAKINLNLRITGRRTDGYHELCSVMQAVNLFDYLYLEEIPGPEVSLQLVENDASQDIPADDKNLAVRAARLLQSEANQQGVPPRGCRMVLHKAIPAGAGLGGGSSNAAAVLYGLNQLWHLQWSQKRLEELAGHLGADVPFFLYGGTALVEGIGDVILPYPPLPVMEFDLIVPPFAISTVEVYHAYDRYYTGNEPDGTVARYEADRLQQTLKQQDLSAAARYMNNDLLPAAMKIKPAINETMHQLQQKKCALWNMTGSGSAFFALGCTSNLESLTDHSVYHLATCQRGVHIKES